MLRRLQRVPIHQKLMLIALLTTGGALLLAGSAIIYFNVVRFKEEMKRDLASFADVFAGSSTAALTFQDQKTATEILRSVSPRTSIVAIALYDDKGHLFAHWERDPRVRFPPAPEPDGSHFVDSALVAFRPVMLQEERLGTIYLRSNLKELRDRVWTQALTVGFVFLASGIVALLLSSWLQRLISGPILALAGTARAVSERRDYSIRADRRSTDELGTLVDAFNDMLNQIQRRDSELQEAKEALEERVRERTRELEQRNEELNQSNKELDDFAYIASHDLKEPLIDSLLQFSRLGRVDLAFDRVNLNEIVAEILDSLAISLQEDRVEVR